MTLYPAIVIVAMRNVIRIADFENTINDMTELEWQYIIIMQTLGISVFI